MGASTFITTAKGKTAQEAFRAAREEALHEDGHGGYSGTIAEKSCFVMIADDGRALRARLARAIEILREAGRAIRSGERVSADCVDLRRRADIAFEIDGWAFERGSKAQRLKLLRDESRRLNELKARCKARMAPIDIADLLVTLGDSRVEEKFGPAGCIDLAPKRKRDKQFLFFGWASS